MAAAVPWIIKGGIALGSYIVNKKAQNKQKKAAEKTGGNADILQNYGQQGAEAGQRNLSGAAQYYRNILSGSKSQMQSALAPETGTVMDYYRGAQGKATRELRGGARDQAVAELDRSRVGDLARMVPTARANAAQGLYGVGATQVGQGANSLAQSGYLNNTLFNQQSQMNQEAGERAKVWGNLLYDVAGAWNGKGGSSAAATGRGGTGLFDQAGVTSTNLPARWSPIRSTYQPDWQGDALPGRGGYA